MQNSKFKIESIWSDKIIISVLASNEDKFNHNLKDVVNNSQTILPCPYPGDENQKYMFKINFLENYIQNINFYLNDSILADEGNLFSYIQSSRTSKGEILNSSNFLARTMSNKMLILFTPSFHQFQ